MGRQIVNYLLTLRLLVVYFIPLVKTFCLRLKLTFQCISLRLRNALSMCLYLTE